MSTVVNKLTKAQLGEVLSKNFSAIKKADKELGDSISYTSKAYNEDEKSVTKRDLLDLVKDAMITLGDKFILPTATPVAENSVKKSGTSTKSPMTLRTWTTLSKHLTRMKQSCSECSGTKDFLNSLTISLEISKHQKNFLLTWTLLPVFMSLMMELLLMQPHCTQRLAT